MPSISAIQNSPEILSDLLRSNMNLILDHEKNLMKVSVELQQEEQKMKFTEDIINTYVQ